MPQFSPPPYPPEPTIYIHATDPAGSLDLESAGQAALIAHLGAFLIQSNGGPLRLVAQGAGHGVVLQGNLPITATYGAATNVLVDALGRMQAAGGLMPSEAVTTTIRAGNGVPGNGLGSNGDLYIQTNAAGAAAALFFKSAGAYAVIGGGGGGSSAPAPWDTLVTYSSGEIVTRVTGGGDNFPYVSNSDGNIGNDPLTDLAFSWWVPVQGGVGLASNADGTLSVAPSAWNGATSYDLGQIVNGADHHVYVSIVNGANLNHNPVGNLGVHWRDLTAPAGITSAYVGALALGASSEATVDLRTYAKAYTPAQDELLVAIGVGVEDTIGSQYSGWNAILYDDNAGAPGKFLAVGAGEDGLTFGLVPSAAAGIAGVARIVNFPLTAKLTSGTPYWLAIMARAANGTLIHYAAGGTDQIMTGAAQYVTDWGYSPVVVTAKAYTIRGLTVR